MAIKFNRDSLKGTTKTQGDFNLSHKFNVEIDGVTVGGVNRVDGLEHEHEVVEYQDGDDMTTHFRPGRQKPGRVTIERDWSSTKEFFNWRQTVINGKVERKSVSIIFMNDAGEESMRVNLFDCYPTKWKGPSLNSKSSGHAAETIELMFERMELK
jgi:phage tail-like protein